MARCKTCREKFDQKYVGQKNCDKYEECREAEKQLRLEKFNEQKKRQLLKQKNRPRKVLNHKKIAQLKRTRVNQQSKKQAAIEREYHAMLQIYDEVTEPVCTGCGKYSGVVALSHSHIISRADCKRIGRPDLIADDRNIKYHCLDLGEHKGCHRKHEARDKTLLDWDEKLEFVKGICEEIGDMTLYNKLLLT